MSKKRSSVMAKIKFGDTWFAESNLPESELVSADAWIEQNAADFPEFLDDLVGNYHKLSVKYDEYHDAIVASVTCYQPNTPNTGGILTSRSNDAYDAIALLLYKVYAYYADSEWPKQSPRSGRG